MTACRRITTAGAFAAGLALLLAGGTATAQGLTVLPVNIVMAPGEMATTLTIINHGNSETSIQVRAFGWKQPDGSERLTPSDEVLISPPIATIPAGGTQVVRLMLRHPATGNEATYRVLFDQIPTAAAPGTVRIALRLSIPVFAEPATRALPHVQFHVQRDAGQAYLVAFNDGGSHETIRDIALTTNAGSGLAMAAGASPYILAGATSRWRIAAPAGVPPPGETLHLTGQAGAGVVNQPVVVVAGP